MLLVFTPALYCNVSDSWMLPSKWQRAVYRRGGHVRRDGAGVDGHVHLVVHRSHDAAQSGLPEPDVHLFGQHVVVQRQSAVAV